MPDDSEHTTIEPGPDEPQGSPARDDDQDVFAHMDPDREDLPWCIACSS